MLIFKLRHYVPLSTQKLIYHSMFQSTLLYLINWGRATKSCLHQLEVFQNRFIGASLFLPKSTTTNLLYFKFQVLKLKDKVKMKIAKFMLRFKNKTLPISFDNYFTNLNEIHKYNTKQKAESAYYHHSFNSEFGRKRLNYECLKLWELTPLVEKECSFSKVKKVFKDNILNFYFQNL